MPIDVKTELETLVSYDTTNEASSGKKADPECGHYINQRWAEFGFKTELLESKGYHTAFGIKGNSGPKILFLAHFDVVPPGDGWRTDPFKLHVESDTAYGRGTCDNKGNIVSMILMAQILKQSPIPATIMLSASGDEEIGGSHGAGYLKEYLVDNDMFPDYVVIADGINQVIIHRRRNILPTYIRAEKKILRTKGRKETIRFKTDIFGSESRHSAYQRLGVDRHAMLAASKYLDLQGYSKVSAIRGGFVKSNVIPDWVELDIIHPDSKGEDLEYDATLTGLVHSLLSITAAPYHTEHSDLGTIVSPNLVELDDDTWSFYLDIRAMTNDGDAVQAAFEKALQGKVENASVKVHAGIGYVDSPPDSELIQAAEWALRKENIRYKLIEGYGASDSRYFAGHGADVFDFGPRGGNLHGPNEWVSLESIQENARFFYTLAEGLSREDSPY
ncbi:MAG: Succinyl-diaminopimelate desuccinylase [Candidatus Thorarchaeota archaeon]|nr:MAG: Succinyl-diaminopimelate desuccinylase [Candidatus Thorarchaeota archaeon]